MQIFHSEHEFSDAASVLALGTFDGVHTGHAALIRRAKALAVEARARAVVCTFDRHPLALLDPANAPYQLTTLGEKLKRFEALGVDAALVKPFTRAIAALPARAYLVELVRDMRAIAVVVGEDHRFGRHGEGDARLIRRLAGELGFRAEIIPPVYDGDDIVSSSLIRNLLATGEGERAMRLLNIE